MDSEIFKLNSLDQLSKRIVRGARVSFKNATSSGSIVVSGIETTHDFYEYLVEISKSGDIGTSEYVFIRNTYTYNLAGDRVLPPVPEYFKFDKTRSSWVRVGTPVVSGDILTSDVLDTLEDDVKIKFIASVQSDKEDFNYIGSILKATPKILVNSSEDGLADLSLTPIPYPGPDSSMVYDDDHKLILTKIPPVGLPVELAYGIDYVINYSQSPIFLFPLPSFPDRQVAFIKFLGFLSQDQLTIDASFTGNFNIKKDGTVLQNLLPYGEEVKVGTDLKQKFFDYTIDYQQGLVNFTTNVDEEKAVNYVFYSEPIFDDGVVLIQGSGDVNNPTFLAENRLVSGVDYILNESTGALVFIKSLSSTDTVKATYFVEGDPISGAGAEKKKLIGSNNYVNTDEFPIKEDSVSITVTQGSVTVSTRKVLIEEEDYTVSYKTGKITFLNSFVNPIFSIEYVPLASISCKIKPLASDPSTFSITIEKDPVKIASNTHTEPQYWFNVLNPNVSVKKEDNLDTSKFVYTGSLKTLTKLGILNRISFTQTFYNISGYLYTDSDKKIKLKQELQTQKIPVDSNSIVVATYSYEDYRLPYSPIIADTMTLAEGSNSFKIKGKDKTDVLMAGSLIKLTDKVSDKDFYFLLKTVSYDGTDTVCAINGTFPAEIRNPAFFISDSEITFVPNTDFHDVGTRSELIVFDGNLTGTVKIGSIIKIDSGFTHYVTSSSFSNALTIVGITPPLYSPLVSTSTLSVSDHPVFFSGETIIKTKYPILSDPNQSVFEIKFNGEEGVASVELSGGNLNVKLSTSLVGTIVPLSGYPYVKDLVAYLGPHLNSFFSTSDFVVTLFSTDVPNNKWKSINLIPFERVSAPYALQILPEVLLNGNRLPFEETPGNIVSFVIENNSIVLSRGLKKNDRVVASYQGRNSLLNDDGDVVNVLCKYFTTLPKETKVTASMDYLSPDQFFIETLREDDYLRNVFFVEVDQQVAQGSGQVGGGVEGSDDAPVKNSSGGAENSYYRLREQEIRIPLFKKIYEYYKGRLVTFGREAKDIVGNKVGNNDPTLAESDARYSFIKQSDLDNALVNNFSVIYPEKYKLTSPLFSERFAQQVHSYTRATFKKVGPDLKAFILPNDYAGWGEILQVNDKVLMDGEEEYLNISAIEDSGKTLKFSANTIADIPSDGDEYGFSVKFNTKPDFPIWDDSLYIGAKAVSQEYIVGTNTLAYGTYRTFVIAVGEMLKVDVIKANGATVSLTATNPSKIKTIDGVVNWLSEDAGLSPYFKITKETSYGKFGSRESVVFRGYLKDLTPNFQVVSFKFLDGTGYHVAKNLGFAINKDYTSYHSSVNASDYTTLEKNAYAPQDAIFITIQNVYNKFNRIHSSYKTLLINNANIVDPLVTNTKPLLLDAIDQCTEIIDEVDASAAIQTSHDQAVVASSTYTTFNATIDSQSSISTAYKNTLATTPEAFILSLETKTLLRANAQALIATSLALNNNPPSIPLTVSGVTAGPEPGGDDARILFGNRTPTASVVLDSISYLVFPKYLPGATLSDNLKGTWDTNPTSPGGLTLTVINPLVNLGPFSYTVNEVSIIITSAGTPRTYLFATYTTLSALRIAIIADSAASHIDATIVGLGTAPSGGLKKDTNIPIVSSVTAPFETLLYSPLSSFNFIMDTAFTISSSGISPTYTITDTDITLFASSVTTVLSFSTRPTLAHLVNDINSIPLFTCTLVGTSTYTYGHLGIKATTSISGPTSVYLGAKADIQYYQISSHFMNSKKGQNSSRVNEINTFNTFLGTRYSQIKTSVSAEKLTDKWNLWLGYRMNRETGCNYQETYITSQIEKNQLAQNNLQNI